MNVSRFAILIFLFINSNLMASEKKSVHGWVDLHSHLASHLAYGFALRGGTPEDDPNLKIRSDHTFEQNMYVSWMRQSNTRIFVAAAMVNVFGWSKKSAVKQIEKQMKYVEDFAARHPERFALAKNPSQARVALAQGKTVFVHALEGGEKLLDNREEVRKLARKGVAMIGPIHLGDNEYGEASIMTGTKSTINISGLWNRTFGFSRMGLTKSGKRAVEMLIQEGIIVDLAHMSQNSTNQSLDIMEKFKAPPIMSHGMLKKIRPEERSLDREQVGRIYKLGGMIGITGARDLLVPTANKGIVKFPKDYCPETADDYLIHYEDFLSHFPLKVGALGWASDFNGFVSHMKPKLGPQGCHHKKAVIGQRINGELITKFDVHGLAHSGQLPYLFNFLRSKGININPIESSAEKFLTIWETVLNISKQENILP